MMLNGHEYVAATARAAEIGFTKEGNCFKQVSDPERLAKIADTLFQPGTIGRLSQVIDRCMYSACLCYGLGIDSSNQKATTTRSTRLSTAATSCLHPAR